MPFPTSDDPTPYKGRDEFWDAVFQLPDTLAGLSIFDAEADPEEYGNEPEDRMLVSLYPPRHKGQELARRDVEYAVSRLDEFVRRYDEMATNLARVRATVDLIVEHHGYELGKNLP